MIFLWRAGNQHAFVLSGRYHMFKIRCPCCGETHSLLSLIKLMREQKKTAKYLRNHPFASYEFGVIYDDELQGKEVKDDARR